jgi:uracil-DNA glycosylase family 4
VTSVRDELAFLRDMGFTHLDLEVPSPQSLVPGMGTEDQGPGTDSDDWTRLRDIALACTKCRLAKTRTQVVYGVGNPHADLMFIGEAPGRDEDLKGEPFVGRAGQLLTDIIKAMKLTRDDVYIANVIKCRPPENRNPEPDELDACRPFIKRQIELVQPKVIVTLGKFALQSMTGRAYAISAARGQWTEYDGIKVMPTYHPAYLLRTPSAKKEVWQDMKQVMGELGISF